jgi:formimidoylglutamate deiminase
MTTDAYADLCAAMARETRLGVAPHSLRAVAPDDLSEAVRIADGIGPDAPIHMHVSEQVKEVEQCLAWSGRRPVAWLLEHAAVGPRWCLIHATHLDEAECRDLAASGAVAGLCPTTEGNLGDGLFPFRAYQGLRGRFGLGGDSHVCVSPAEELRWLDYGQRLRSLRRSSGTGSVGAALLRGAWAGGAQALGRSCGAIAPGCRADLVVLDTDHPALAGRSGDALLDSWIFCGNDTPVRDVMVDGRWVVRDGEHIHQAEIAAAFRASVRRLTNAL